MTNYIMKKYIKVALTLVSVCILVFLIALVIFKYEVEGEKRETLPYTVEQISVVSTADGISNQETSEYLWSGELIQVNDIYVKITKNPEVNGIIENVVLDNIKITKPKSGEIKLSRLTKNEDTSNKYIIEDINKYIFVGKTNTSLEELTIANQGGSIGFRTINTGLGEYNSNEDEINYDGRILNIENILNEDIKFKLKFNILIQLKDSISYKTSVELNLPIGNIIENGIEIYEFDGINDLIYKRV